MTKALPSRDEVGPDTPLRLSVAAALAYPGGAMTASGLKFEAKRGNLVVRKLGKDYFTTLNNIEEMRRRCRVTVIAPIPCVYVVGFGPYVKIGFTADHFEKRLRALHGGFPEQLTTYATLPNATLAQERALHRRFAALRLQGEWFKFEDELRAWIEAGCPL